jgi:hypothetical protein
MLVNKKVPHTGTSRVKLLSKVQAIVVKVFLNYLHIFLIKIYTKETFF